MLTFVVGQCGTEFKVPSDAVNIDQHCDRLDEFHVAFTLHKFMINAVADYIFERVCNGLKTTIFIWDYDLPMIEPMVQYADIRYQKDTCFTPQCMKEATTSIMRKDGRLFPLCTHCKVRADAKVKKD
jgi:hypothetical protein